VNLTPDQLQSLLSSPASAAWEDIRSQLASAWTAPCTPSHALADARSKHDSFALWELALSHSVWPLWHSFTASVPRAAVRLGGFWDEQPGGRAILILDALSLREFPVLLHGAKEAGFTIHQSDVLASELPPETTTFAKALAFPSRSSLENNGGSSPRFPGAFTATNGLPWEDAATLIPHVPDVIYWHHWMDEALHQCSSTDGGFDAFFKQAVQQLSSDAFWAFVRKLATGRRVVITSDHGYAQSHGFHYVAPEQKDDLRDKFAAQRFRAGDIKIREWLPPMTLTLEIGSGAFTFVTGRRKWHVGGGFPTLSHGGLTLMDVFVPWLELSL
jgi:hypothetical protein